MDIASGIILRVILLLLLLVNIIPFESSNAFSGTLISAVKIIMYGILFIAMTFTYKYSDTLIKTPDTMDEKVRFFIQIEYILFVSPWIVISVGVVHIAFVIYRLYSITKADGHVLPTTNPSKEKREAGSSSDEEITGIRINTKTSSSKKGNAIRVDLSSKEDVANQIALEKAIASRITARAREESLQASTEVPKKKKAVKKEGKQKETKQRKSKKERKEETYEPEFREVDIESPKKARASSKTREHTPRERYIEDYDEDRVVTPSHFIMPEEGAVIDVEEFDPQSVSNVFDGIN
jgi:hypothetical protein